MPLPRSCVAILFHENERRERVHSYAVAFLAEYWRRDGIEVRYLWGVGEFVPADVLLVHVDLSVVPEPYLEFARRYPVALNAGVKDVRKSVISQLLVGPGDPWKGPVIVKSDLNCAGRPERRLDPCGAARWRRWFAAPRTRFRRQLDYVVLPSLDAVPRRWFRRRDLVVERFVPEREGQFYCVRTYQFLGPKDSTVRLASRSPIVGTSNHCRVEPVAPHPEIVQTREALGFDYGKFDYVVHDGQAFLLDANKTTGVAARQDASLAEERRHRAAGIRAYLEGVSRKKPTPLAPASDRSPDRTRSGQMITPFQPPIWYI